MRRPFVNLGVSLVFLLFYSNENTFFSYTKYVDPYQMPCVAAVLKRCNVYLSSFYMPLAILEWIKSGNAK